jgi:hypothetical protein
MPIKSKNIFSHEHLQEYCSSFRISDVSDIEYKKEIIQNWIDDLICGKLESLKEEEIKSRFILEIFGEVLEFSFWNSRNWFLREETKTKFDGTKPDATLGYFTQDKQNDDVRVVIEIKDANTDLDLKQSRDGNKTPVDQAFEYAPKMGGTCKWVIVSNFKEIRFYAANDRTKYQVYFLADLIGDPLKEFLFLFQKERFIAKMRKSKTDKFYDFVSASNDKKLVSKHILDELYYCVYKFKGLGFIDPNYLSSLYPFNILEEHVWHYDDGVLFTINTRIFELLSEIEFKDNNFILSQKLTDDFIELKVDDAIFKLGYVFEFLNKCNIYHIKAVKDYMAVYNERRGVIGRTYLHAFHFSEDQGVIKYINVNQNKECDCYVCNFRNLDFKKLLGKLKTTVGNDKNCTLELAYGNYLTTNNDFKTGYTVYKHLHKNKVIEGKGIEYFVTKLNQKRLYNLIKNNYHHEDRKEILDSIKSIDLDKVIHDELEFEIDSEVREYLINIKENKLIQKIKDEVKEINVKIDDLKKLYDGNGAQSGGSDLGEDLMQQYYLLYSHLNLNFLVGDIFKEYKDITKDIFEGLINSFLTPFVGLKSFEPFFIMEVIIHLHSSELEKITKRVEKIIIDEEGINELMQSFLNYFHSFYKEGSFAGVYDNDLMKENLLNYSFENRVSAIFHNLFLILSKIEITKEQFAILEKPIINFLQTEDILYHFNLEKFCNFVMLKGNFFEPKKLIEILQIVIKRDIYNNIKYNQLVSSICLSLHKFYPETIISNKSMIKKAMANCSSSDGDRTDYGSYCFLLKVVDPVCQNIIKQEIDSSLDNSFNDVLYSKLLWEDLYNYTYKNYFDIYIERINHSKGYGVTFINNNIDYSKLDYVFFNFALLVHFKNIVLSEVQREKLKDLSNFENWLLDPHQFDYSLFNIYWLTSIRRKSIFLNKIKSIQEIKHLLEKELRIEFTQDLSEIYVKYFI